MADVFELETIDAIPERQLRLQPPPLLTVRKSLRVGDAARLFVFVNGCRFIAPWVVVKKRTRSGYVGQVGGICNSHDWLPYGTLVPFTADHVVDTL